MTFLLSLAAVHFLQVFATKNDFLCQASLTLPWTRACPQGCSRQTAWRSTGGGTPYTRRHASHRWWVEDRATPDPAGSCGFVLGWPRTWKGHSTGALWSAGLPPAQWQFAGKKENRQNAQGWKSQERNQIVHFLENLPGDFCHCYPPLSLAARNLKLFFLLWKSAGF